MANGRHLRDTYVYDGTEEDVSASRDERMRLFDLTRQPERRLYEPPNLYYRADDGQRTLMTGQVLNRGMFGDLLGPARGDRGGPRHRDAHRRPQPERLEDLWNEAKNSPKYREAENAPRHDGPLHGE